MTDGDVLEGGMTRDRVEALDDRVDELEKWIRAFFDCHGPALAEVDERVKRLERARQPEQPAPQSKAGEAAHALRQLAANPYRARLTASKCREIADMLDAAEKALGAFAWRDSGMYRLERVGVAELRRAHRLFGLEG